MKKIFFILVVLAPLVSFSQRMDVRRGPSAVNTLFVNDVNGLTNALNTVNPLANSTNQYLLVLGNGTYYVPGGDTMLVLSNYVGIVGQGMFQTTIVTANDGNANGSSYPQNVPFLTPYSFSYVGYMSIIGTNRTFGNGLGGMTKLIGTIGQDRAPDGAGLNTTNVILEQLYLDGGIDCLYIDNSPASFPVEIKWDIYNCKFRSQWDVVLLTVGDNNLNNAIYGLNPSTEVNFYNCDFKVYWPSNNAATSNGMATCINVSGKPRTSFNNCSIDSRNGTNRTCCVSFNGVQNGTPIDATTNSQDGIFLVGCNMFAVNTNTINGGYFSITNWNGRITTRGCNFNGVPYVCNNGGVLVSPDLDLVYTNSYITTNVFVALNGSPKQALIATNAMLLLFTNSIENYPIELTIYNNGATQQNITYPNGLRWLAGGLSNSLTAGKELTLRIKKTGTNISLTSYNQVN